MTPDPTLAARLADLENQLSLSQAGGSVGGWGLQQSAINDALCSAYRSDQLITLADAEAMVLAENEACALAVRSRSDVYAEKRKRAHDFDRQMLMDDIIMAHDYAINAIRARVHMQIKDAKDALK